MIDIAQTDPADRARAIHATLRRDMLPPAYLPFAESIERVGEYVLLTVLGAVELRDAVFPSESRPDHEGAAQLLGLLDGSGEPTASGRQLLHEASAVLARLADAFRRSRVAIEWATWAGCELEEVDERSAAAFLASRATPFEGAARAARALEAWLRSTRDSLTPAPALLPADPSWSTLQRMFPVELRTRPIAACSPPTRVVTFCEQETITTIGGLLELPEAELFAGRGVGRTSVRDLRQALAAFVREQTATLAATNDANEIELPGRDVLELLKLELARFDDRKRDILERRIGLGVARQTLAEIGARVGLTRERVRQIESQAFASMAARATLGSALDRALNEALAGRSLVSLAEVEHAWLDPAIDEPALIRDLIEHLLPERWRCEAWGESLLIARPQAASASALLDHAKTWLDQRSLPLPITALERELGDQRGADPDLVRFVVDALLETWSVEVHAGERMLLGRGNSRAANILELLLRSPEPVALRAITDAFGRGSLPPEVVHVRRGWITLPDHLPGFDHWSERLGPPLRAHVEFEGPEQQWPAATLLAYARSIAKLPEWITPTLLSELLVRSGAFVALGQQRLVLAHATSEAHELVEPKPIEPKTVEPEPKPTLVLGESPPALAEGSPAASPLPPGFPSARELGLPRNARSLYARLSQEAPGDWALLEARIARHIASFESAAAHSEFLPIADARALGDAIPRLAARVRREGDPTKLRLVWVAARYFEISDDGSHDYAIGGLDDDVALVNAVARWSGASDLQIEQR